MADTIRRPGEGPASDPRADGVAFDPNLTPIPRRRMLVLMGVTTLAASGGLGAVLAGCSGPPVTVTLDVDLGALEVGVPKEIPFTLVKADGGASIPGSTWLVKKANGDLISYDPRCTHGLCHYLWSEEGARFKCGCHEGQFALDGAVLAGPPPRPLDRWPIRVTGSTVEVDVPGNFQTPKESLPA